MKTKMKTKLVLSMLTITVIFTACDKETLAPVDSVITATITELDAQASVTMNPPPSPPTITGEYTKFSFSEGSVVEGDDWDVAFRSTSIIVNGGVSSDTSQLNRTANASVYLIDGTMDDITTVDTSLLQQDGVTSTAIIDDFGQMQMGWCVYDHMTNIISPIAGKVLVFRTHDNKYAKVEILNFYDSEMSNPFGGFYTFNYVYQPNENTINF